jgi:hypothetical protein
MAENSAAARVAVEEVTVGYPALSTVMGPYPGLSMFKRFGELNARNLLYMQAEIIDLEQQLHIISGMDQSSTDEAHKKYATNALALRRSGKQGDGRQWRIVLEIREKLKEYSEYDSGPRSIVEFS